MSHALEVRVEQIGPSTSKGVARSHTVLIDRPVPKGGADQGPLGGELLLLALGGCFTSNLLAAIRAREAAISDVRVSVIGTIEGPPDRFSGIALKVSARHEDSELLGKLITIAERSCLVTNTLRAGTPISIAIEESQIESAART